MNKLNTINYIKYKISYKLVFALLLVLLGLMSVYIFAVNQKVQENIKIQKDISIMFLVNKKFDLMFHEQMSFLNYDVLNKNIKDFRSAFVSMEKNPYIDDFFANGKNKKLLKNIKVKFDTKKRSIQTFVSANAVLNSSLRNFISMYEEMIEEGRIEKQESLKEISKIHSEILQLKLGVEVDTRKLLTHIKKRIKTVKDQEFFNYLRYASVIVKYWGIINNESRVNKQSDFEKSLHELKMSFSKYSNTVQNRLYATVLLFVLLIFLFISTVFFLLSRVRENSRKLYRFQKAIQNSYNTVVLTDKDHKILYVNDTFEKTTGYTKKEAIGQTPAILQSGLHDRDFYEQLKHKLFDALEA